MGDSVCRMHIARKVASSGLMVIVSLFVESAEAAGVDVLGGMMAVMGNGPLMLRIKQSERSRGDGGLVKSPRSL